jgi:phage terminase large subunit-like protein
VSLASLEGEAQKAQTSASYKPTFLRLSLNRRVRQAHRWLDIHDYDAPGNLEPVGWTPPDGLASFPDGLRGRKAWAGVDLSAVSDLTALGVWIPDDPNDDLSAGLSITWSWLPEDGLLARCDRDGVPYDQWARDGWVQLTEGNTVDYQPILDTLYALKGLLRMEAVGLDRWQAHRILQELTAKRAAREVVELPQTYQGLSEGCKAVERAILSGRYRHHADPVKRWAYSQVEVSRDQVDNIKPIKPDRGMTAARIDPVMADVIAAATWQRRERRAAPSATPVQRGAGGSVFGSSKRLAL